MGRRSPQTSESRLGLFVTQPDSHCCFLRDTPLMQSWRCWLNACEVLDTSWMIYISQPRWFTLADPDQLTVSCQPTQSRCWE